MKLAESQMGNGKEEGSFTVLLRGCSLSIFYQAGVVAALRDLSPQMLKSASKLYGASSGSILATLILCDSDIDEWCLSVMDIVTNNRWYQLHGRSGVRILRNVLDKHLPSNAHQLVAGKLHVIVTRVHDCRSVAVSDFSSREELIQAILCSCFVPLWFGILPPMYHGVRYVDGEVGMWRSSFASRSTITVSAFAGEYDVCPRDGSAAFLALQLSDSIIHLSKRNLFRLAHIVLIPPSQVLESLYTHGYQDTVSYLKRLNVFGINYLDKDFMCSLANGSHQKGEGTLHWKPKPRLLQSRATDSEVASEEKPGTIQAADELEEKALHLFLHHQEVWAKKSCELPALHGRVSPAVTGGTKRSVCWSVMVFSMLFFICFFFLSLSTFPNLSA